MCGRYYIDDEMVNEIEKIVRQVNDKLHQKGDVYPTNTIPVIHGSKESQSVELSNMTWGFPKFNEKGVIINARCETVKEKRTFSESARQRRCIIPASGFYEWDKAKNKVRFERSDNSILYMAGVWKSYEDAKRFVILTTQANESVREIHERMPLLLEKNELENWILESDFFDFILQKKLPQLKQNREYEQSKLSF
jgi:putative SOS response-associated peptidase YedK